MKISSEMKNTAPQNVPNKKLLIYFHGNAEDCGNNLMLMATLRDRYNISVLAVEYPGYGFFSHKILNGDVDESKKLSCSPKKITENSISIFEHVIRPKNKGGLGFAKKDVILFGRSMGSGPSTMLANLYSPRGLILMSPYTSIRDVASNVAGGFLSLFVSTHFNNLEEMKGVRCPVILIHGKSDTLIPS